MWVWVNSCKFTIPAHSSMQTASLISLQYNITLNFLWFNCSAILAGSTDISWCVCHKQISKWLQNMDPTIRLWDDVPHAASHGSMASQPWSGWGKQMEKGCLSLKRCMKFGPFTARDQDSKFQFQISTVLKQSSTNNHKQATTAFPNLEFKTLCWGPYWYHAKLVRPSWWTKPRSRDLGKPLPIC